MPEATFEGWVRTSGSFPPYCIDSEKCNLGRSLEESGFRNGNNVSVYITSKTLDDEVDTVELKAEVSRTTGQAPQRLKLVYLTEDLDTAQVMSGFKDNAEFTARVVPYSGSN